MNRIVTVLAAGLLAQALGGPAAAAPTAPANSCFRTSDMRNHTVVDDHTIYVDVGGRGIYRITAAGRCFAGMFPTDPLVIGTTASSGYVCKPIDLDLGVRNGGANGITTPCIVNGISRLTAAEAAAIPKKLKP